MSLWLPRTRVEGWRATAYGVVGWDDSGQMCSTIDAFTLNNVLKMVRMANFMLSIFYLYFLIGGKKHRERIKLVKNNDKGGYHVLRGVNLKYSTKIFQNKQLDHCRCASIWCGGRQRIQSRCPDKCLHIRLKTYKPFKVGFSRQGLYITLAVL